MDHYRAPVATFEALHSSSIRVRREQVGGTSWGDGASPLRGLILTLLP